MLGNGNLVRHNNDACDCVTNGRICARLRVFGVFFYLDFLCVFYS
jgi:hypothetical protein